MCRAVMHLVDPVTKQKRTTCPDHPQAKLRIGLGCPIRGCQYQESPVAEEAPSVSLPLKFMVKSKA